MQSMNIVIRTILVFLQKQIQIMTIKFAITLLLIFFNILFVNAKDIDNNLDKYHHYRERLLNEFIVVSPNVEQFGVNIPAVDRKLDSADNVKWISWSDGNSNFHHWLGILATEYRLLKNNKQDYQQTLALLTYTMLALERLDLYAEYLLRKHHNKYLVHEGDTLYDYLLLPEDINGFLLRDDVSLGFWRQYYKHFKSELGWYNEKKDGTQRYRSVFQKGLIEKQGMSQDNIYQLLQSLAIVKQMLEPESIENIDVKFINTIIPKYLTYKQIISQDTVYFCRWVENLADRLVLHIRQGHPREEIVLKPFRGNWRARPSSHNIFAIMSSRWYIMNPVTDTIVREGSGEDMGVWMNSYGAAEAGNFLNPSKNYHYDNSEKGLSAYLFKSLVFKNMRFLKHGGFPIPDEIDDYMFRTLASIADVNWDNNDYGLFHLLRDKRKKYTYEHNALILFLLHKDKYKELYSPGVSFYEEDKLWYHNLLNLAPKNGPTTDTRVEDYHPYWTSSSRLIWPNNDGRKTEVVWDYAGMDYMYLYNLYCLVFDSENYYLPARNDDSEIIKIHEKYPKPRLETDADYNYLPPTIFNYPKIF
jgi:hypothetical protein